MSTHEREKQSLEQLSAQQISHILGHPAIIITAALLALYAFSLRVVDFDAIGTSAFWRYHIDIDVYREGGRAFLRGENLYTQDYAVGGIQLPFTYPPLAAILFAPLAAVPLSFGAVVFDLASMIVLWWCLVIVLRHAAPVVPARLVALLVLPAALFLEPVTETLDFVQVNIFLMALVLIDILTKKPWLPRGFWIGFAAAIKLTPAVFGLYFLIRRDWKSAGVAIGSGLGFTALAWLISPSNSMQYWLHTLNDPSRIGGLGYAGNQSIRGLLFRLVGEDASELLWKVSILALIAVIAVAMYRSSPAVAVVLNSLVALLCSPVSWSHHWVWMVPALVLLGAAAHRHWTILVGFSALLFAGFFPPHWMLPHHDDAELGWNGAQQVLGSSYVLLALVLVVGVLVVNFRKRTAAS
ncbi:glycosyltransferase 87 family protein [Corynebacterium freiburgense]|uniref:glycosyltransferase 87 family protein n=1 Tax=Corynebacterium freiburgense TaxID=556548 RepID=UPI00041AFB6D|nr:glycosyltransferase 87 family protein [Corynebacterium freiburgense]WJZ03178.1 Polyprenol-phosphate-mannose-dependent alpha-(1-2)-phosphatidylinositol mannoside mannosyltransferase [Corynebacterium freiburgense]